MASVQIRIPDDLYNAAVTEKGRLSIGAYFAEMRDEVIKLREELRKKSSKK